MIYSIRVAGAMLTAEERMARLIGKTHRGVNWMLWATLAIVVAIFGGAGIWLSTFLSHAIH